MVRKKTKIKKTLKCSKCNRPAIGHYITTTGEETLGCKKHFEQFPEDRRGLFSPYVLKQRKSMSNSQRMLKNVIFKANISPEFRDLRTKLACPSSDFICPACGDIDKGNRMNGKPYCFKCQTPLVKKSKVKNWIPVKIINNKRIDTLSNQFKEV